MLRQEEGPCGGMSRKDVVSRGAIFVSVAEIALGTLGGRAIAMVSSRCNLMITVVFRGFV